MTVYERVCPVCGKSFTSYQSRAVYDRDVCRVSASRARRRLDGLSRAQKAKLKKVRVWSSATADRIEAIVQEHGTQCFDQVVDACLVAAGAASKLVVGRRTEN